MAKDKGKAVVTMVNGTILGCYPIFQEEQERDFTDETGKVIGKRYLFPKVKVQVMVLVDGDNRPVPVNHEMSINLKRGQKMTASVKKKMLELAGQVDEQFPRGTETVVKQVQFADNYRNFYIGDGQNQE